MTVLTPSNLLIHLLTQLTMELPKLNAHDPALTAAISKISTYLLSHKVPGVAPLQLDGEELLNTLRHIKELVDSYDVKPEGKKPSDDIAADLPNIIYNAIEEVDHLIIKEQVIGKTSISHRITKVWDKLATYHVARR